MRRVSSPFNVSCLMQLNNGLLEEMEGFLGTSNRDFSLCLYPLDVILDLWVKLQVSIYCAALFIASHRHLFNGFWIVHKLHDQSLPSRSVKHCMTLGLPTPLFGHSSVPG